MAAALPAAVDCEWPAAVDCEWPDGFIVTAAPSTAPAAGGVLAASPPHRAAVFTSKRAEWTPRPLHAGLRLSPLAALDAAPREPCPGCGLQRRAFCHTCLLPLVALPRVQLPCEVLVLTHAAERSSAATGVHLALLAPGQVRLLPLDGLPPGLDPATTLLLFPSATALPAEAVDSVGVTTVLVVDSKWGQAAGVVAALPPAVRHVRLRAHRTSFWRYHTRGVPDDGLCTAEAVYFLLKALCPRCRGAAASSGGGSGSDCHCYDDLLWLFAWQHGRALQRVE
jgi:DTW domain-containing protein YfiP